MLRNLTRPLDQSKRRWDIMKTLRRFDYFSTPVPTFNTNNSKEISTNLGSFCTLLIACLLLLYGAHKLVILFSRFNPQMANVTIHNQYSSDEPINLNENNFRVAFGIYGLIDKKLRNDPNYVKWDVRIRQRRDGKETYRILQS